MKNHGFTLIELIIVIVIIGVLASIVAPMMAGMKAKAIASEAVTAMGAIRTAIRQYRLENGNYPQIGCYASNITNSAWLPGLNLRGAGASTSSLDGTYFGEENYYVLIRLGAAAAASCDPDIISSHAPKAAESSILKDRGTTYSGIIMYLGSGRVVQKNATATGYPAYSSNTIPSDYGDIPTE